MEGPFNPGISPSTQRTTGSVPCDLSFEMAHAGQANELLSPITSPLLPLMIRVCIHVFWTRPSTDSPLPSAGGQTKGSSSVIVPEAWALSIDLLSPNFSVTYALLNSHYCSHWSLIRGNNGPVVTEGENMSRPLTAWAQTHDFSSRSPPGDLRAPRAGPRVPTPNLNPLQMNQKIGSPFFHQILPPP